MSFPVLLIDDDPTITRALTRSLALEFDLTVVNSASAALEQLSGGTDFPVIVTDLRMPMIDGIQFIDAAKEQGATAAFIVLTGSHDLGATEYIQAAGTVFRTVSKPAKKSELIEAIQLAFESHSEAGEV